MAEAQAVAEVVAALLELELSLARAVQLEGELAELAVRVARPEAALAVDPAVRLEPELAVRVAAAMRAAQPEAAVAVDPAVRLEPEPAVRAVAAMVAARPEAPLAVDPAVRLELELAALEGARPGGQVEAAPEAMLMEATSSLRICASRTGVRYRPKNDIARPRFQGSGLPPRDAQDRHPEVHVAEDGKKHDSVKAWAKVRMLGRFDVNGM